MADHDSDLIKPFVVEYNGKDANRHALRADLFAQSVEGAAKYYNAVAHYCALGYVPTGRSRRQFQCYTEPTEPGSLRQILFIAGQQGLFTGLYTDSISFLFGLLVDGIKQYWSRPTDVEAIVDTLTKAYSERAGSDADLMRLLIMQAGQNNMDTAAISRHLIDRLPILGEQTRTFGVKLVAPIGFSCDSISQLAGTPAQSDITEADAEAIRGGPKTEVGEMKTYRLNQITEVDRETGHCVVDIEGVGGRVIGKITDPALKTPGNAYTTALNDQTSFSVQAKAVTKNGAIHRLFISDTVGN